MSDRRQEFRVGVVALATAVITILLVSITAGTSFNLGSAPYTILIRVDRAPGVGPNTPVRKDGVLIGRVVGTKFIPGGGVLVTTNVKPGAPIYQSDICRIRPSSLFGDAVINFAYAGAGEATTPVEAGATVAGEALPDPIEALTSLQVDFGPTIQSIGTAAEGVTRLTTRFNGAMGEEFSADQVNSLLDELTVATRDFQATMKVISRTMTQVDALASDDRLQTSLAEVPSLLSEARTTVARATSTLDSISGVVVSAEQNFRNLEGLTEPLGERGPELSELLISSIENLDQTLADASRFATALGDSQGTIARLVNDPMLYENVNTVVGNVNAIIMRADRLLRRARPIVEDARIASDKVAREPGRVISGAFNRGPGIK